MNYDSSGRYNRGVKRFPFLIKIWDTIYNYFYKISYMGKSKEITPNFWSVYWAINKFRFSKDHNFTDKDSGKVLEYHFIGMDKIRASFILSLVSMILWMSPAFLIIMLSALYAQYTLWSFIIGIIMVILYHFAGMYYCIRGPMIEYSKQKKWFFSR